MKLRNKRGVNPTPLLGLGILLFALFILYNIFSAVPGEEDLLGKRQYDFLHTNERAESAQIYVDLSGKYSSQQAFDKLFAHSGLYETANNPTQQYLRCGNHVYPSYTSARNTCTPEFYDNYRLYLNQYMNNYLSSYIDIALASNLQIDITTQEQDSGLANDKAHITARLSTPQQIPLLSKTLQQTGSQQGYPQGLLGGHGTEQTITCSAGQCFAQVGEYFHDLYLATGISLPYVVGGESPYTYEDTILLQESGDFFENVDVTKTEPQSSTLTKPGFDSAGYIWWVGKHAGIPALSTRKEVAAYYADLRARGAQILCERGSSQECTRDFISVNAHAGDLLFSHEVKTAPTQIMISLGGDSIVYSKPGYGLSKEALPTNYALESLTEVVAVLRITYPTQGKETLQGTPSTVGSTDPATSTTDTQTNQCQIGIDFSHINRDAIKHSRKTYEEVVSKLEEYNAMQYIDEAHTMFPRVPKEYVIAIINVEAGGGSDLDAFLSGQTRCTSKGYCSVMQMGKDACDTVTQSKAHYCDFNFFKTGAPTEALREAIISGTAYLNWLMTSYPKYLDPNNVNYYFLSMSYNYGIGTFHQTLKAANARTGKDFLALEWSDITYDDVMNGGKATGFSWADEASKWDEAYEYPNLVGASLSQKCTGVYYSGVGSVQTAKSKLSFTPAFAQTITADFGALEKINEFTKELQTCDDNLRACVEEKISAFNQENKPRVYITRNEEDDALAYDFVEQLTDCYANEQDNCTCVFEINYTLPSRYEDVAIEIKHDGETLVGERELIPGVREGIDRDTQESITILPSLPTLILANIILPPTPQQIIPGANLLVKTVSSITGRVAAFNNADPNTRKIAIIGSSSTAAKNGYVDKLAEKGFGEVVGFGVSGESTAKLRDRFERDIIENNPDVVVIFNGVNDLSTTEMSMTSAKKNLQLMLNDAKLAGIDTVLVTIQPTKGATGYWDGTLGREPDQVAQKTIELNNWMLTAKNADVVVDAYSVLGAPNDPEILNPVYESPNKDGLHLNDKGHELLADIIYTQAQAVLLGDQIITPIETETGDSTSSPLESIPQSVAESLKSAGNSVVRALVHTGQTVVDIFNTNPDLRVPDYIEIFADTKQKTTSIEWDSTLRDLEWDVGDEIDAIGVVKLTSDTFSWVKYKAGQEHLQCKDNKHYFRFQAHFAFTPETIDFSVYLDDTTVPPVTLKKAELGMCKGNNAPIISWSVPTKTEGLDTFAINFLAAPDAPTRTTFDYTTRVQTAQEIQNVNEVEDVRQLYVKRGNGEDTYYYMVKSVFADEPFVEGRVYYFELQAIDAYDNTLSTTQRGEIDLQTISPTMYISSNPVAQAIAGVLDGCKDAQKNRKTINEAFGVQTPTKNKDKPPDTPPGTQPQHQFEVYPGVFNPETGDPLYRIADIPNIICDESASNVGQVCAGNLELVEQLMRISQEVLEPQDIVMNIAQAFRTWDIQNKFWIMYDKNRSRVCDPGTPTDPRKCPHMMAGAIDISMWYKTTGQIIEALDQEAIMCSYGFVRYGWEAWHFEYGTNQWRIAEDQRITNPQYCYYGPRDVLAGDR